jgi:hypothetical protein
LKLAEDVGIGTRDLKRIEVVGTPIKTAMFDFAKLRAARPPQPQRLFPGGGRGFGRGAGRGGA